MAGGIFRYPLPFLFGKILCGAGGGKHSLRSSPRPCRGETSVCRRVCCLRIRLSLDATGQLRNVPLHSTFHTAMKKLPAQKRFVLSEDQAAFAAKRDNYVTLVSGTTYVVPSQPTFDLDGYESVYAFPVTAAGQIGGGVPVSLAMLTPWSYGPTKPASLDVKQAIEHCSACGLPCLRLDSDNTQVLSQDFCFTFGGWQKVWVKSSGKAVSKNRMQLKAPGKNLAAVLKAAAVLAAAELPTVE